MNSQSGTSPQYSVASPPVAAVRETRPLFWSIRREIWENRSIYIAPLVVGAVLLFGFAMSTIGLPHRRRATLLLDPAQQRAHIEQPYVFAAGMLVVAAFIVGVFYCLDALHGERRDRSILFWKSLPVSDLTTVLSKASVPLVVLPLITFAIIVAMHVDMLLLSNAILLTNGLSPATPGQLPLTQFWQVMLYALGAMALWHAPIYGWLLLVSAWARRATFLWAFLPPVVLAVLERMAFQTTHISALMRYRMVGWVTQAFVPHGKGSVFVPHGKGSAPIDPLTAIDLPKFLSTPGLWIGLVFAAACLGAAVRLRRNREPI
ncbi:MAG TPA: ABC transporter permease [Thermoanaerobaculia bacterium]|jgi:ABC-2 type transport system permease protein|nr:ABC transporter permease [Thermoanaerobaculia bacterium]